MNWTLKLIDPRVSACFGCTWLSTRRGWKQFLYEFWDDCCDTNLSIRFPLKLLWNIEIHVMRRNTPEKNPDENFYETSGWSLGTIVKLLLWPSQVVHLLHHHYPIGLWVHLPRSTPLKSWSEYGYGNGFAVVPANKHSERERARGREMTLETFFSVHLIKRSNGNLIKFNLI